MCECNEDARRLLDDKFGKAPNERYNSIARPVLDPKDKIELSIGLKLSQIADIVGFKHSYFPLEVYLISRLFADICYVLFFCQGREKSNHDHERMAPTRKPIFSNSLHASI